MLIEPASNASYFSADDEYWMQRAYELSQRAELLGEVPVGAVLILNNELIGEGFNQPIATLDPTAHAEIIALKAGANHLHNYRLLNTTLYVTLEPCMMCAGAMVHARIKRLVYGASDAKAGAITSKDCVLDKPFLNHRIAHQGGLLASQCSIILSQFFQKRRGA